MTGDHLGAGPSAAQPAIADGGFAAGEVCSIVGITSRQLNWWARTGAVDASIPAAPGRRHQPYSYADLLMLTVVKRILDAGLSMGIARTAIDSLRSPGSDVSTANLVIDDHGARLAYSGQEIMELLKSARLLHIIPLGGIMSELAALSPMSTSKG